MMTDPISDMLTRLRNASRVHKGQVTLPSSTMKYHIAKILEKEGYVGAVEETQQGPMKQLKIGLLYHGKLPAITQVKRVSKPGCRIYRKSHELRAVCSGAGISIVSTPSGLMTNREARVRHLGGEVICEIF